MCCVFHLTSFGLVITSLGVFFYFYFYEWCKINSRRKRLIQMKKWNYNRGHLNLEIITAFWPLKRWKLNPSSRLRSFKSLEFLFSHNHKKVSAWQLMLFTAKRQCQFHKYIKNHIKSTEKKNSDRSFLWLNQIGKRKFFFYLKFSIEFNSCCNDPA